MGREPSESVIIERDEPPPHYDSASANYTDDRVRVLNHASTFGVFDRWGDIQHAGQQLQGIYHDGTRYLSLFRLRLNGRKPLLLSSSVKDANELLSVDLINPELVGSDGVTVPEAVIHISRNKFIWNAACYERITITNFDYQTHHLSVSLEFGGDFKDIFEVRGIRRERRGEKLRPTFTTDGSASIRYLGLDKVTRVTDAIFAPTPKRLVDDHAEFDLLLAPDESASIECTIFFRLLEESPPALSFSDALHDISLAVKTANLSYPRIITSNEEFNVWLERSQADLISLTADTPNGKYPFAGVPWFNTVFGRDGIITALESLWIVPEIAEGVLHYLAVNQATELDERRDAEPGKILHEVRGGEMVELNELPFKRYYGSVDSTPLFVVLAGEYYQRTGNMQFIRTIWPQLKLAVEWIDRFGDIDGDGFIDYQEKADRGLRNQGWKDSDDAVSHEDGRLAEPPIALCEVQGYVFDAKRHAALLASALGEEEFARRLDSEAAELKRRFNETFWDEELGTYVLALDGEKQRCRVRSSNAGHCLTSGIADARRAESIAQGLLAPDMYTGWGIRTLSSHALRFNPMSYHNGSVWPHDNAYIAMGMSRYGFQSEVEQLLRGMFDATFYMVLHRLPELFCGFERRSAEGPTAYPVACSPQAWAVATVFAFLQSLLALEINALEKKIYIRSPKLPEYLDTVVISGLPLDGESIELTFHQYKNDVVLSASARPPGWKIVTVK